MSLLPSKGYLKRMRLYFREMYPPGLRVFMSALLCISFFGFVARIEGFEATVVCIAIATLSVFCVMLILRLMDELKDREIDAQLFPTRPLPSGMVLELDIKFSLVFVTSFYVLINLCTGKALWMALAVLAYSVLMFRHFFVPALLRRNLLLTLATHNPIIPLLLWYLVTLYSADQGVRATTHITLKLFVIVMYWLVLLSWELSRKIRSEEEEDAYVTYSRIFGRKGAVILTAAVQSIAFLIGIALTFKLHLSAIFPLLFGIGFIIAMAGHVRFVVHPNTISSKLRWYAEAYALSLCIAQIAGSYSS
ncbi:MAG: hypothetical protein HY562_04615 [Ignavibacteriales bacterium]|nr:hypothetical protein [Ignavibacteriales bacterium]